MHTIGFDIPETKWTRAVHFIMGRVPGHPFGFVLTAQEGADVAIGCLWFRGLPFKTFTVGL